MLSAARYPIVLYGPMHLPPILPHDAKLYAELRQLHTYLALLLFATILGHLGAALFHGLVYRDGVFTSMMPWRARAGGTELSAAGNRPASDRR
jgi:cytochrome b561